MSHDKEKYGIISANGIKHPHEETLKLLHANNVKPYCTNFSKTCFDIPYIETLKLPDVLKETLKTFGITSQPFPCCGNIKVNIQNNSFFEIAPSNYFPCPYHVIKKG